MTERPLGEHRLPAQRNENNAEGNRVEEHFSVREKTGEGNFRLDINGLRAWAVLGVVFYHFGVPGFGGGFVGVDVFFVISGFLMAGIVIGGLESGRFGVFDFYMARARRIIPALLGVVLVVLLIGWFILMPSDYQILGRHARESLFFTSNLTYLREAGYFDTASHEKWLLHTWSLSVEWQFYLFYPLVLMLLQRFLPGRRNLVIAHLAVLLLSLGLSVFLVASAPSRAFFLLPPRAWELLLGGLVFLLGNKFTLGGMTRRNLEVMGLGMIILAVLGLDSSWPWPGALALLPTLGAALVLVAARQDSWATASTPAQWLGTRSYSIYLWHWPLMVWLTYYSRQREVMWVVAALLLSLLLGHVSYHLIETPVGRWLSRRKKRQSLGWLLVGVVLLAGSAQAVRRSGFPDRLPADIARVEAERHNKNPRQDECLDAKARCVLGGKEVAALVIGDSHADAIVNAVVNVLPVPQEQGVYFKAESGCLLVDGANWALKGQQAGCLALRKELDDELPSLYPGKPVILINRVTAYAMGDAFRRADGKEQAPMVYFSHKVDRPTAEFREEFRQHYLESTCRMTKNHPVYVLMPVPDMPVEVPRSMVKAMMRGQSLDVSTTLAAYHARNDFVRGIMQEAAQRCGVTLLDPMPYLCDERSCHGQRDGIPLYVDDDHLSERGNRLLSPLFRPLFTNRVAKVSRGESK